MRQQSSTRRLLGTEFPEVTFKSPLHYVGVVLSASHDATSIDSVSVRREFRAMAVRTVLKEFDELLDLRSGFLVDGVNLSSPFAFQPANHAVPNVEIDCENEERDDDIDYRLPHARDGSECHTMSS